jgi:predicted RND superfamily exporter protein
MESIMNTLKPVSIATRFAEFIVRFPKLNVFASLLLMALVFSALPSLYKDTRADAFLADDNPALVYREKVKAQFGLSDPIVVAIMNESKEGIFNPTSLNLVNWLSEEISNLDNINADRVTSLATENNITGSSDDMLVEPFFDDYPETQQDADRIWQQVSEFPLYMGKLVAQNRQATLIVAELLDEDQVEDSYQKILELVENSPKGVNDQIHVAGEGAIAGYLGSYIDADAQRLNPIAGLIITVIILFAFGRLSPALLSNVVIAASVLMTLGIMAYSNVAFFVITNALPVILIGISVADSIHIYSHYFELQAKSPLRDKKDIIVETFEAMWRPITLTTLTTVAGFMGLYFAAYMPPFKYFGLFTSVGVIIAWIYSLIFLPAALAIIKPSASKKMVVLASSNRVDRFASVMVNLGKVTLKNSNSVIGLFLLVILVGLLATTRLTVDEDRIATFHKSEALFQADKSINQFFDGTYNLDIVVEASEAEALFEPEKLRKIEALQDYALSLQNVNGANSIVDYLKQMNRSLNGGSPKDYQLPQDQALIAQYFLIYSASSDPTDFEEEIDYDYRVANIRLNLNEGSYQQTKHIVEDLETYIAEQFQGNDLSATLSGRVTVNYHWIKDLGESHFVGLALSLFLVWTVSSILFGSITAGTFAIIPVVTSILLVYSAMVALGIKLGIGTSMFASVAIGLGVDFAIHTIDRLRSLFVENKGDWDAALTQLYPSTGRALFFNYLAITLGFAVLISSKVVPLTNFGTIVVVSVTVSFLASLSLLPALFNVIKPSFISDSLNNSEQLPQLSMARKWLRISSFIIVTGLLGSLLISNQSLAAEDSSVIPTDAMTIVNNINQVDDGEHVKRNLTMTLIDKRGKTRVRETRTFRKYYEGEKRTILFYQRPSNVKGTAFLTLDYKQADRDDNQWLYLPALRKVRRISVSDRGDYFLGTDFTYEDIKLEGKLDIEDYNFEIIKTEVLNFEDGLSYQSIKMNGIPKSRAIAKELGYGRTEFWVDTKTWLIIKADYWDQKGKLLKTLINADIRAIDDILTRHKLTIDNHKTGHKTIFEFSEVDYQSPVKDTLFSKRAMKQGK